MKIDRFYHFAAVLLLQEGSRYVRNEGLHMLDGGYCLDRLGVIPAGSVESIQYGEDEDECIPDLTKVFID